MKKLVIAWDLDGTLISARHRSKRKQNGEFDMEYWLENSTEEFIMKDTLSRSRKTSHFRSRIRGLTLFLFFTTIII